ITRTPVSIGTSQFIKNLPAGKRTKQHSPAGAFCPTQPDKNSAACDFVQHRAVWRDQLDVQRHLPNGVRRTAQAWIVTTDAVLDAVKHRSEEHTSELQSLRHLVCR